MNGHHNCSRETESCLDTPTSFECHCKPGYERLGAACEPICTQGCHFGHCVAPDKCQCFFSYVGDSCGTACQCNFHSECASVLELDKCLHCHNNTMGSQCQFCKPFFVGDPKVRKGGREEKNEGSGKCESCFSFCHGHSSFCLPSKKTAAGDDDDESAKVFEIEADEEDASVQRVLQNQWRGIYPEENPVCVHCEHHTEGPTCNQCQTGYFRSAADTSSSPHVCQKCECNGHHDPRMSCGYHGESCTCTNNTISDITPCNWRRKNCHRHQCSRCREYFLGDPVDGHQCYRQMNVNSEYCFNMEPSSKRDCSEHTLLPGQTVFFAVQPKFMNVDIRVFLDLSRAARVSVWLSPDSQTFQVDEDGNRIYLGDYFVKEDQQQQQGVKKEAKRSLVAPQLATNVTIKKGYTIQERHRAADPQYELSGHDEYNTFMQLETARSVLSVNSVGNRLIVSLPESIHDLRTNRFYIVIQATPQPEGSPLETGLTYGSLYFRQDQLHIDLFVFFSVFFACFFLFLSVIVLAWQGKTYLDRRRTRRRLEMEMVHMAKRPFAKLLLIVERKEHGFQMVASSQTKTPAAAASAAGSSLTKKKVSGIFRPISNAIGDSRDVTLPLLDVGAGTGASSEGFPKESSSSSFSPMAAAIEPTCDGAAGVTTVLITVPVPPSAGNQEGLSFGCVLTKTAKQASK